MENVPANMGNSATGRRTRRRLKRKFVIMIAAVLLALTVIISIFAFIYKTSTSANIDGSKYQAVFMTNGQVYFGKLRTLNGGYMRLTDIYYLQAQTTTTTPTLQDSVDSADASVKLIKLGNEIHGPTDEMIISKDQILFFENLKKDGKVTASIVEYQKSLKK